MSMYKQETKNYVRHSVIRNAVESLTEKRGQSCCVRRSYVRDVYDYFSSMDESREKTEVSKIDVNYIKEWERMHDTYIGAKRPEDLSVCYLSGPEPENDFNEFISMGVLPQNIWAFEFDKNTYLQALNSFEGDDFMQPKIIKTSIEYFFENTPKKFDIVYIDACATFVSRRNALKCISALFKYHRLNSPGVLISNFAYLDDKNEQELKEYVDMIALYNYVANNSRNKLLDTEADLCLSKKFFCEQNEVQNNLVFHYGEFITRMLCNIASISIPVKRFVNSNYLKYLISEPNKKLDNCTLQEINNIKDNNLYKYFMFKNYIQSKGIAFNGKEKIDKLIQQMEVKNEEFSIIRSIEIINNIKCQKIKAVDGLNKVFEFFEENNMYQFLDKPNKIFFFDTVINQLSYPMHYVCDKTKRYTYVAKEKRMFTDLIIFDECRYIYDWVPAIDQITRSFSNLSWQYVFRFAIDGLIKQRINYNNEFFYGGSVVPLKTEGFTDKTIAERERVN